MQTDRGISLEKRQRKARPCRRPSSLFLQLQDVGFIFCGQTVPVVRHSVDLACWASDSAVRICLAGVGLAGAGSADSVGCFAVSLQYLHGQQAPLLTSTTGADSRIRVAGKRRGCPCCIRTRSCSEDGKTLSADVFRRRYLNGRRIASTHDFVHLEGSLDFNLSVETAARIGCQCRRAAGDKKTYRPRRGQANGKDPELLPI
jgi:hypothetical protein